MRGSPVYQVTQVLNSIAAFGESKHQAKEAVRAAGAKTWHEMGQHLGVYSFNTINLYRSISIEASRYAKEAFVIKDITKLSPEVVSGFLEAKIADGLKYGSFKTYCAALEKLAVALKLWAQQHETESNDYHNYDWSAEIQEAKIEAKEVLDSIVETRAYEDPEGLIKAISYPSYHVVASAQYSIGARISELDHVRQEQFLGDDQFKIIKGKGGKDRVVEFRHGNVYEQYMQMVINNLNPHYDKFTFNRNQYRMALKAAADKTGQAYTGSHGLRWNYAQERFQMIQQGGGTWEEALVQVAHEMGHSRGDITLHYLR